MANPLPGVQFACMRSSSPAGRSRSATLPLAPHGRRLQRLWPRYTVWVLGRAGAKTARFSPTQLYPQILNKGANPSSDSTQLPFCFRTGEQAAGADYERRHAGAQPLGPHILAAHRRHGAIPVGSHVGTFTILAGKLSASIFKWRCLWRCSGAVQGQAMRTLWPLQAKASPPIPALRLVLLLNIIALATLLCFHGLPLLGYRLVLRRLLQRTQRDSPGPRLPMLHRDTEAEWEAETSEKAPSSSCSCGNAPSDEVFSSAAQAQCGPGRVPSGTTPEEALRQHVSPASHGSEQQQETEAEQQGQPEGPVQGAAGPARAASSLRPAMPLQRGISAKFEQLERRRPRLCRALAIAAMSVACMFIISCNVAAPRFVDASIGAWWGGRLERPQTADGWGKEGGGASCHVCSFVYMHLARLAQCSTRSLSVPK
jgi:hypothetical protein